MLTNLLRVGVYRMGPEYFQWCPVTEERAMSTNWSTESSIWLWGKNVFTLRVAEHWNKLPIEVVKFSSSQISQTWLGVIPAHCCRIPSQAAVGEPALPGEVGLDLHRSLRAPPVLWFCEFGFEKGFITFSFPWNYFIFVGSRCSALLIYGWNIWLWLFKLGKI